MENIFKITVGTERLSITVTRKTEGDLIVSQHSSERWFASEQDATEALRQIMEAFLEHFTGTPASEASAARVRDKASEEDSRARGEAETSACRSARPGSTRRW